MHISTGIFPQTGQTFVLKSGDSDTATFTLWSHTHSILFCGFHRLVLAVSFSLLFRYDQYQPEKVAAKECKFNTLASSFSDWQFFVQF
jgi:hypothetical protein